MIYHTVSAAIVWRQVQLPVTQETPVRFPAGGGNSFFLHLEKFSNQWSPALNRGKSQIFFEMKRSFSHEIISSITPQKNMRLLFLEIQHNKFQTFFFIFLIACNQLLLALFALLAICAHCWNHISLRIRYWPIMTSLIPPAASFYMAC